MIVRHANTGDADVIVAFNRAMALETEGKVLAEEIASRGVASIINQVVRQRSVGIYPRRG